MSKLKVRKPNWVGVNVCTVVLPSASRPVNVTGGDVPKGSRNDRSILNKSKSPPNVKARVTGTPESNIDSPAEPV